MGADIDGWIEYRDINIDEETWYPAMKLGVVYHGRDYEVFRYLFGIRKWSDPLNPLTIYKQPVAAGRGLPVDVSPQTKIDATHSSLYAHTWITWNEIKDCGWKGDMYWDATIKVLEVLGGLYGDKNVRLVVWFED